ncbi:MAG: hypothetical protein ACREAK_04385, partial [Nitrosarchaeum sp.]
LMTALYTSDDGTFKFGLKDPDEQSKLDHDYILYKLLIVISQLKYREIKSSSIKKLFELAKTLMNQNKIPDQATFDTIIKYIEKELPNYKRRSFGERLFKKN